MARWEPNARDRFLRAALDLFTEQGYDATTVTEIAERAGLTRTTFFRHFRDKREVLFAGQEFQSRLLAETIAAAPAAATPLQAVGAAIEALAAAMDEGDRRELAAGVRTVIAGNGELRERAVFKRAGLTAVATEALHRRAVPEPAASLAAEIGIRAFYHAFEQWTGGRQAASDDQYDQGSAGPQSSDQRQSPDQAGEETFSVLTQTALRELLTAVAALD